MASRRRPEDRRPDPGTVRIELDLPHEILRPSRVPVIRQLEAFLREQEVEEEGSLMLRSADLLDVLGGLGFSRVDHWEIDPGGWLPLPEAVHAGRFEPVAHLLRALRGSAWAPFAKADGFGARLSSVEGGRVDAHLLRRHREREHSITVLLWDEPSAAELKRVVARLRERFHPLKVRLTR